MNAKYWFLVAIVAGLLAWAGVETQKLVVARRQLASSQALEQATSQRVQVARLNEARSLANRK